MLAVFPSFCTSSLYGGFSVCRFRAACFLVAFARCGLGGKGATVAPLLEALAGIWFVSLFVNRGRNAFAFALLFCPSCQPAVRRLF